MRFKDFIREAEVKAYDKEAHSVDSIIKLLQEHCKEALHAGAENEQSQIWRGSKSAHKSGIFRPGEGERQSQNTANYYTVLLDSNPLNKAFPKRAKSFIATTNRRRASNYANEKSDKPGTVLALFPFDSTQVGVANTSDIWNCKIKFPKYGLNETIISMNHFWERFFQHIGKPDAVPTMPELINLVRANRDAIDDVFSDETSGLPIHFIQGLEKAYSYKSMGCEVSDPGEVQHENSEVWFSGPCVGVVPADWVKVAEEFKL